MEDVVVAAGGVVAGVGGGIALTGIAKAAGAGFIVGPAGVVGGILGGIIYEFVVAPLVKVKASEFADAWHEFWW